MDGVNRLYSLPMPTRDEIMSAPVAQDAPANGFTSSYSQGGVRPASPIVDDPTHELERELERGHPVEVA